MRPRSRHGSVLRWPSLLSFVVLAAGLTVILILGRARFRDAGSSGAASDQLHPAIAPSSGDPIEAKDAITTRRSLDDPVAHDRTAPDSPVETARVPSAGPFSRYATTEEMLADLWGDRWPEVQAEAKKLRVDLAKVNPRDVPAWESIGGEVESCIRSEVDRSVGRRVEGVLGWGSVVEPSDFHAGSLNPAEKKLADVDIQVLTSLADSGNRLIQDRAAVYKNALLDILLHMLAEDKIAHHPIAFPAFAKPGPERLGELHFLQMAGVRHWGIYVVVRASEHPALDELWGQVQAVGEDRDDKIKGYIESL